MNLYLNGKLFLKNKKYTYIHTYVPGLLSVKYKGPTMLTD